MRDLAALKGVLADGPALRFAVVFGSAARSFGGREVMRPDSDVDVGIWPERAMTLAEENDLASRLEVVAGRSVDLVRLDLASAALAFRAARDAVALIASRPEDVTRWRARIAVEHADFEPTLREGLERYRRAILRGTR